MTRIGVLGAGGRMGQALIAEIGRTPGAQLSGAAEQAGHFSVGTSVGPDLIICANTSAVAYASDVLLDFTAPQALQANLDCAIEAQCPILVGTTGLDPLHQRAIDAAAKHVAVLQAANTSLGVNLLAALVEQAAARLPAKDWDIEIVELHHRHKRDAPSGTALMLGEAAARGRGIDLTKHRISGRDGVGGVRHDGDIGFAALRGGSAAGDHMVLFAGEGERIELGHRAETRDIFARGAVRGALWLAGRPKGRYGMRDVLGL